MIYPALVLVLLVTTACETASPAISDDAGAAPKGATAQCRDHTYSHSTHRSGTCSQHRGVAVWYLKRETPHAVR